MRVISPSQRPLPDNTQHSQQTNIHALGGIRTHNLSRRATKDPRLRPRGHWYRHYYLCTSTKYFYLVVKRIFKTNYIVFATFSSAQKSTLILEYILLKYRMTTWKWQFDILMLNGVSWLCIVVCLVAVHSSILINEVGCLGNRWHQVRAIYPLSLVSALLYFKRE